MNPIRLLVELWRLRWIFRSLPSTLYFNFHYLPFAQAIHLPVLLYKPKLKALKGEVKLVGTVRFGMVQLGRDIVPLYPNQGIMYENNGGKVTFNGNCVIGNNSCISVGRGGVLEFGNGVCVSAALKLVCFSNIQLHDRVHIGWDVMLLDCDLHKLSLCEGGYTNPCRPIEIGHDCWLGYGCAVLKGTHLPPYTTVSAKTTLNKRYDFPSYCVIGTDCEVKIKRHGVYRNYDDDMI